MAKRKRKKRTNPVRPLLTDSQCSIFLKSMREFGYPSLTMELVKEKAQQVADGTYGARDVIALIMAKQIDDAVRDSKGGDDGYNTVRQL